MATGEAIKDKPTAPGAATTSKTGGVNRRSTNGLAGAKHGSTKLGGAAALVLASQPAMLKPVVLLLTDPLAITKIGGVLGISIVVE